MGVLEHNCCFPTDEGYFFVVSANSNQKVGHLLKVVCDDLKAAGHSLLLKDIRLYKANISTTPKQDILQRTREWLYVQPAEARLHAFQELEDLFPDGPPKGKLHIIIANTEALAHCLDCMAAGPSPSATVANTQHVAAFFGDQGFGCVDRIPVAIFSPPLARLERRIDILEQVPASKAKIDRAGSLLSKLIGFCKDENERRSLIKSDIDSLVGEPGQWETSIPGAKSKPDAVWWHGDFPCTVLRLKNLSGVGGNPVIQGMIDFSKIISSKKLQAVHARGVCNFPVLIVGVSGNRIRVSAAIFLGRIYVTTLFALDLSSGFHISETIVQLARVFEAVSMCHSELKSFYTQVSRSSEATFSAILPNPTSARGESLPSLTYRRFMTRTGQPTSTITDLQNMTTAMYIAVLESTGCEVVVKFTARYNEHAHRKLADAGLAPKLHFCGRVVGNVYMVIMDRVMGKSIWQLLEEKVDIPPIVSEKVEEALSILHENNIVFGDLRENNVVYGSSEGLEKGHAFLVDFDWAGTDGVDRYPASLNEANDWEDSVSPYGIMQKTHDTWQLDRLKGLCTRRGMPI
ncbi:hypothetical protein EST38_g12746 [Candolleomyces aberdarensis]|uniref:Crinkler effector protein N-terminal domain-containing protein n=1 Tax=Candolleomyces aberdarensis TaxID=2316362 RepID=A0A4V1Q1X5_9AGAR|nr:hypothetical protein EST38_g12746 [Candolleomyces aberdarensis]